MTNCSTAPVKPTEAATNNETFEERFEHLVQHAAKQFDKPEWLVRILLEARYGLVDQQPKHNIP
ncbi:MAG TPA: hypothetical protein VG965_02445 [Patescibacteria group bacterium]|nr:hypothetical protein [Patescibacteria group bacterium]